MVRILLKFTEKIVAEPIASQVIIEHKVPIAILHAHINSKGGEILAEVPDNKQEELVDAFRKKGVIVTLPKLVEVDTDKCLNCGACVALCPVEAISVDKDGLTRFDKSKCLGSTCGLCVDACPVRAITSIKTALSNENFTV